MMLTVEDMNLILSFTHNTRPRILLELTKQLPLIKDPELKEACEKLKSRLEKMSDTEYRSIDFTVYEEADYE